MHRPKKVLSAGSLCGPLLSIPYLMPQKDLHITPKVSYFSFKYVIKYVIKTNINFRGQALVKPLQSAGSRALFYPISIMSQISNEDSGIF